jgi:hypothetical protein
MTAAGGGFGAGSRPAGIGPDTPMQKVVHPDAVDLYLSNTTIPQRFEPSRTAGFCSRFQDITERTASGVAESYGLDLIPGWPWGDAVHVLRFYAYNTALFTTPFGGNVPEGAERMGTGVVLPPPFLGTGYTPSRRHVIPEYFMRLAELPAGTEMYRINSDGTEDRVGRYVNRRVGWVPFGRPVASTSEKDAQAWTAARHGLAVRYQGQEFDADFGPQPGQVTLLPLPGDTAPDDFEERAGERSKTVLDSQCEELRFLRQLCTWRDTRFELIHSTSDRAVLHYPAANYQQAERLGLTEVDYRLWRAVVPRNELTDLQLEATPLSPVTLFGR